jgi:hypothetical protein
LAFYNLERMICIKKYINIRHLFRCIASFLMALSCRQRFVVRFGTPNFKFSVVLKDARFPIVQFTQGRKDRSTSFKTIIIGLQTNKWLFGNRLELAAWRQPSHKEQNIPRISTCQTWHPTAVICDLNLEHEQIFRNSYCFPLYSGMCAS